MVHAPKLIVTPPDLEDDFDVIELESRIEAAYNKESIPYVDREIEVDSEYDFGTYFYRVWCSRSCLGCFYQIGEEWVARPFYKNGCYQDAASEKRFKSHKAAQNYIIRCYRGNKGGI